MRMTTRFFVTVASLIVCTASAAHGQEPLAPLTQEELIDLMQNPVYRQNPSWVLNDFIKVNKIAFLPTHSTIRFLRANGVPEIITRELKYHFSSQITYRVCEFRQNGTSGAGITSRLNTALERRRIELKNAQSGILSDKMFNPIPCGSTGVTPAELDQPHIAYVLLMGEIDQGSQANRSRVTARLVFVSQRQNYISITQPMTIDVVHTTQGWQDAVNRVAEWSIRAIENEIQ